MWNGYGSNLKIWLPFIPAYTVLALFETSLTLYVVESLKQDLIYVGILMMVGEAVFIPASAFWGYLCDYLKRYKVFLTIPFLFMGMITFSINYIKDPYILLLIYGVFSLFLSMHRPAVSLFIAESSSFDEWLQVMSLYMLIRSITSSIGFLLGTLCSNIPYSLIFIGIGILYLLSFILSSLMIYEPQLKIERKITSIDRRLNVINYSLSLLRFADDPNYSSYVLKMVSRLQGTGFIRFLIGVLLFTLATSLIFTPMPIILKQAFAERSTIFLILFANSLASSLTYLFIGKLIGYGMRSVRMSCLSRSIITLILIPFLLNPSPSSLIVVSILLASMGVMWALFDLSTNYLSLELSPYGGVGVYFSLSKLGSVIGAFLGGFLTASYGLATMLLTGCVIFLTALIAFLSIREHP
ncbi:MAG: MFS transporter [Nitrososphaerota archaeon]|nr:MFS transporter [Nitrososphaerales archaeon]MDW8044264.1 MFS transporter [Nitrososphaerota archaeon]